MMHMPSTSFLGLAKTFFTAVLSAGSTAQPAERGRLRQFFWAERTVTTFFCGRQCEFVVG